MSDARPTIAFIRATNLLTDDLMRSYVAAQQIQITRDFLPAWGLDAECVFVAPGEPIPAGAWQIWLKDHSTEPGAYGFHDDDGNPTGYVFVADIMADKVSWTVTASHETLELLTDPLACKTVEADGWEYALEPGDAPEDDAYAVPIDGHLMSNAVMPAWFDPNGSAPWTIYPCPAITAPFMLAPGGYIGRRRPGGEWEQQMARESGPRQEKRATSRTMRRFSA